MDRWRSFASEQTLQWLMEENNPSVRYFTLTDLLDTPIEDDEALKAKAAIQRTGLVPQMLEMMARPSYQDTYRRFYTYKYEGLVWSLITLAELGAEPNDQIRTMCEYLLLNSQELEDGGFSMNTAQKTGGGRKSEVIPCLTGNLVWVLIHFGYLEDERLQKALDHLVRFLVLNDGEVVEPQVAPYDRYDMCWGAHTCFMAVVKALKGLSAVPKEARTKQQQAQLDRLVEFMLIHHIYKSSHNLKKKAKPLWLHFAFPLMYQTDVLEILDILVSEQVKDRRTEEALQVVLEKQNHQGRWLMGNSYASERLLIPMERKGEESKWVTLRSLRVIKRYSEQSDAS